MRFKITKIVLSTMAFLLLLSRAVCAQEYPDPLLHCTQDASTMASVGTVANFFYDSNAIVSQDSTAVLKDSDVVVSKDTIAASQDSTFAALQDSTFAALQDSTLVPSQDSTLVSSQDSTFAASQDSLSFSAIDSIAVQLVDSLGRAYLLDSLGMPVLDSLGVPILDSIASGLKEVLTERELRKLERERQRFIRDSIRLATPRILDSYIVPDSLSYRRMISWTNDTYRNEIKFRDVDSTYNDWYTEYPFFKKDVNANYLGVIGSAAENMNYFRREELEVAPFFNPYLVYSYTPETVPYLNVKTPYTLMGYWGTLFAYREKEEMSILFQHSQNITPKLNISFYYQKLGAKGLLEQEITDTRTLTLTANYVGEQYVAHGGIIRQRIIREENGGIQDPKMVTDTLVDAKTIPVTLSNASNDLKRTTFYISHSYGLPIRIFKRGKDSLTNAADSSDTFNDSFAGDLSAQNTLYSETLNTDGGGALNSGDSGTLNTYGEGSPGPRSGNMGPGSYMGSVNGYPESGATSQMTDSIDFANKESIEDGTMAFIGHYGEFSTYTKSYKDRISDPAEKAFYHDKFYINPSSSNDSLKVINIDNRLYLRLQPWSKDAIVSKIDGGAGYQLLSNYNFSPQSFLSGNKMASFNNLYFYASAGGRFRKFFAWEGFGKYNFAGYNKNDLNVNAKATISFYPFKDPNDPISLTARFSTALTRPDWYSNNYYSNHYVWTNNFEKVSKTKIEGEFDIPRWNLSAFVGYSLIDNNIYYDTLGVIRQEPEIINVLSAYLKKDFKVWLLHLDNKLLFQYSSRQDVLPLPTLALHLRYYFQYELVKDVLTMQVGADATFTTKYFAPAYNPALGVFQLQETEQIGNNPYIDIFANFQWKRATFFLKCTNVAQGWPSGDYFSAFRYIKPKRAFKIGLYWPFYIH